MTDEITELLKGDVKDISKKLPEASPEELEQIKAAEVAGDNRADLIEAIDLEIATKPDDSPDEKPDDKPDGGSEDDGGAAPLPKADKDAAPAPEADTTAQDIADKKAKDEAKNKPKPSKGKKVEPKKSGATRKPKKGVGYRAVKQKIRNPHTGDVFNKAGFTDVKVIDNWLDAQMEAGLIVEVKIGED